MFCPKCGKEVEEDASFCWFCGFKQPRAEEREPLNEQVEEAALREELHNPKPQTQENQPIHPVRPIDDTIPVSSKLPEAEPMPSKEQANTKRGQQQRSAKYPQGTVKRGVKKKKKSAKPTDPTGQTQARKGQKPVLPLLEDAMEESLKESSIPQPEEPKSMPEAVGKVSLKARCSAVAERYIPELTLSKVLIFVVAVLGVFAFFGVAFSFCSDRSRAEQSEQTAPTADVSQKETEPVKEPEPPMETEDTTLEELEDGQSKYVNEKYGYSIVLPSEFTADLETKDGVGRRFSLSEYEMSVKVYGGNEPSVEAGMGLRDFYQQTIDNLPVRATYTHLGSKSYVVSWKYEDTVYYQKTYVGENTTSTVLFEYPADNKNVCDRYLEQIVKTFEG